VTPRSFANPTQSYLDDLVSATPGWYVLLYLGVFVFEAVESVTAMTVAPRRPLLIHRRLEHATTLYVAPLADIAGGVDLSIIGSAGPAGLIYVAPLSSIKA
jgi:hypothetical protein